MCSKWKKKITQIVIRDSSNYDCPRQSKNQYDTSLAFYKANNKGLNQTLGG